MAKADREVPLVDVRSRRPLWRDEERDLRPASAPIDVHQARVAAEPAVSLERQEDLWRVQHPEAGLHPLGPVAALVAR